ncbi:MAG: DEAD/DEAH box helicase [Acidimicrobiia bacterium]
MTADAFFDALPFEPDDFQRDAAAAIESGAGVVVTAPTGAGKTLVAEVAVHLALEQGRRAFYTTPIKALSNQKFHDFVAAYGPERVGLLTGDTSINADGDVVVMTTEVLRNMIYAESDALDDVRIVVLDEVHYLADRARGPVWEEVIIHAPQSMQLVALSATISNPREFVGWVRERRGETALVETWHRPVPLEPMYAMKDRWGDDQISLRPVFVDGRANRSILHQLAERTGGRGGTGGRRRAPRRFVTPRRLETIEVLEDADMLPGIYFIFSRRGCEDAARTVATVRRPKPDPVRDRIIDLAEAHTRHLSADDLDALAHDEWLDRLERGVAAHHAGMVPAFKEAVEACFVEGLLDVVFATETLALGINMPARSVVLESLTKWDGEAHESITASQYTQLTGRAGRRGIDEVGYGIVLHSPWMRFERVVDLVGTGASPLASSFRPTYNMAVNLIANYERHRAEELLAASFAQYQRSAADARATEGIELLRTELDEARREAACELGDVWDYLDARGGGAAGEALLEQLRPGDVIDVPRGARPGRYMVLRRETEAPIRIVVLSTSGKVAKLPPEHVVEGSEKLGWLSWKGPFRPRDKQFLRRRTQDLRAFTPRMHEPIGVDHAPEPHPVAACPDRERHVRAAARVQKLEGRLEREGLPAAGSLMAEFDAVLGVLGDRGYVDGWGLGPKGDRLRRIYSERDLLVAEVLVDGTLAELAPGEVAAVLSGFVFDPRGELLPPTLPTPGSALAGDRVIELWSGLQGEERRRRLTETPPPEFGFAAAAYAWTNGADLDDILDTSPIPVGDFVRVSRQLLDLLRQVREADPDLAPVVGAAIAGIDRGIVASGVGA